MNSKVFWRDAAERAIKTFAQALLSVIAVAGVTVLTVDWVEAFAIGATAALVSVLTSIVSVKIGEEDTASLVHEVTYDYPTYGE